MPDTICISNDRACDTVSGGAVDPKPPQPMQGSPGSADTPAKTRPHRELEPATGLPCTFFVELASGPADVVMLDREIEVRRDGELLDLDEADVAIVLTAIGEWL